MVVRHPPHMRQTVAAKRPLKLFADAVAQAIVPAVSILLVAIIFSAPFGFPGQAEFRLGLILGIVWLCTLYRPGSMPVLILFLCGLVVELFSTGPLGLPLLWMLAVCGVAHTWRFGLMRNGFLAGWCSFAAVILCGGLLQWGLACFDSFMMLSPVPAFFQCALTIGIYPFLYMVFAWGFRVLADSTRS